MDGRLPGGVLEIVLVEVNRRVLARGGFDVFVPTVPVVPGHRSQRSLVHSPFRVLARELSQSGPGVRFTEIPHPYGTVQVRQGVRVRQFPQLSRLHGLLIERGCFDLAVEVVDGSVGVVVGSDEPACERHTRGVVGVGRAVGVRTGAPMLSWALCPPGNHPELCRTYIRDPRESHATPAKYHSDAFTAASVRTSTWPPLCSRRCPVWSTTRARSLPSVSVTSHTT